MSKSRPNQSRRLRVEPLEQRRLLTGNPILETESNDTKSTADGFELLPAKRYSLKARRIATTTRTSSCSRRPATFARYRRSIAQRKLRGDGN